MLRVRASPTGLPYTAAPRNRPVLATGFPGITERGVRSILLTVGGRGGASGAGGRGDTTGGPNGGVVITGDDGLVVSGSAGRSGVQ